MRVLIIDNYDSFTYNLFQYVGETLALKLGHSNFDVVVKRNDEIGLSEIKKLNPNRIIISPGPGTPTDKKYFGICNDVILRTPNQVPVMGVCLGMQGIAHCFGGNIIRAPQLMHGKTSTLKHDGKGLHRNIPQNIDIMRYHSLIVDPKSLPSCLEVNSVVSVDDSNTPFDVQEFQADQDYIMGIRHKDLPIEGIQYHPESFATEGGKQLLANFLF